MSPVEEVKNKIEVIKLTKKKLIGELDPPNDVKVASAVIIKQIGNGIKNIASKTIRDKIRLNFPEEENFEIAKLIYACDQNLFLELFEEVFSEKIVMPPIEEVKERIGVSKLLKTIINELFLSEEVKTSLAETVRRVRNDILQIASRIIKNALSNRLPVEVHYVTAELIYMYDQKLFLKLFEFEDVFAQDPKLLPLEQVKERFEVIDFTEQIRDASYPSNEIIADLGEIIEKKRNVLLIIACNFIYESIVKEYYATLNELDHVCKTATLIFENDHNLFCEVFESIFRKLDPQRRYKIIFNWFYRLPSVRVKLEVFSVFLKFRVDCEEYEYWNKFEFAILNLQGNPEMTETDQERLKSWLGICAKAKLQQKSYHLVETTVYPN